MAHIGKYLEQDNMENNIKNNTLASCKKDNKYLNLWDYSVIIVDTVLDRDSIPCKLRQNGMIAIIPKLDYIQYQLQVPVGSSKCSNENWVELASEGNGGFTSSQGFFVFQTEEDYQEFKDDEREVIGQVYYLTYLNKYLKLTEEGLQEITLDQGVFEEDFEVKLKSGNLGKYKNGDIVPAKGKTPKQVLIESVSETIPPVYVYPGASLSTSNGNTVVEIGTTISFNLTGNYTNNDAGGLVSEKITKDSVDVSSTNTYSDTIKVNSPISYRYEAAYSEGPIKNDNMGNPSPDNHVLRGIAYSNTITYSPTYLRFYGAAVPNLSNFRILPNNMSVNSGKTFNLATGTIYKDFYIVIPEYESIKSIIDTNIGPSYDILSSFNITGINLPNAGGDIESYKLYKLPNTVAYGNSHNLQITIN